MPPTASSSSTLFLALSRRQTFHKSRKAASTKHLNWPYPLSGAAAKTSSIHPDRLVEAGFYSTPIDEDATVTTCFACGVVVGMWEEGEDALFRHEAAAEEAGIRCPFATVRRHAWGEEGVDAPGREKENWDEYWGDEGEWHPRGERMNEARRGTFDVGWPHDDDEGGVPTRDEIAAAGWSFRPGPTAESADQCACIYCDRTVEGWEAGDDPIALHKRKVGLRCPFFLADEPKPKPSPTPVSTSASASSKTKRGKNASTTPSTVSDVAATLKKSTRGRATKVVQQDGTAEDAPDATETMEESEPVKPPKRQSARKGKTTTTSSTKGKAKKGKVASTPAQSDVEEQEEEVEVVEEPAPVPKKTTRSRAASNASTTSSAMPPPRAAALSRSVRGRKPVDEADVEVVAAPAQKLKKSTRGKKALEPEPEPEPEPEQEEKGNEEADESIAQLAAIANAALELQDAEVEVEVEEVKEKPKPAKGKKAAASVKSKKAAAKKQKEEVEQVEDVEMQPQEQEREERPAKPRSKEAAAQPVVEAAPPAASASTAAATAPARSPLSPTVSPTSPSRPIRALPSKVHASKSPSTASVKAPTPPQPTPTALPAPVLTPAPAPSASVSNKSTSASPAVDPTQPWSPPSNAFASDLLSLLPPPTEDELSTLTVGAWYTLCAQRIQDRFEAETDELRRGLEGRIQAGRERLKKMCEEAKERELREEAEENRRRKEKAREKKLAAAAAAAGAGGRSAVKGGGGSARKLR
ncbi:chromosome segregation protein, BIR1 [Rhodosporidium toruloides NP11] [Rhodotorula toruloides]|uniref:BY PROTMAP: gi/472583074/gb/EMS20728.1/ chromosome segregation protein, BIR1 [Rhodosporidium toruloides NP11] n=1 Tax=Rhodotorula toruloides TaxID=5286 RepID=A0A0K3CDD0_RHOTO|nr:chromosome segregation protein, BIR1 [Rhodosporidium toruloides NP11] [Rhodotorula toruloides]